MLAARRLIVFLSVAVLAVGAVAASSTSSGKLPAQTVPSPPLRPGTAPAHIAVIVMENKEYGDVIGAGEAPFTNRLARQAALATQMYAVGHPSLPNYLALLGGSTFGISSDCTDCRVTASSLVDQLVSAGLSWRAYLEGLPGPCFTGAGAGDYAKKHDPFAYFTRITSDPARCHSVVPLSRLSADERAGRLPRFTWISPNLCHDTHDCSVATGDRFLSGVVPPLLRSLGPRGLLVLTWDEGSSDDGCCALAAGGHITSILAGGLARARSRSATPLDQYSILQTIEDLFRLPRLRGAACVCTPSLAPLLRR